MRTVTWMALSSLPLLAATFVFTVAWYATYGTLWPRFGPETILWPILFVVVWKAVGGVVIVAYRRWADE